MIVRGPRLDRDFTILANATLRDQRLSWKARGLLGFLLSQSEGYSVNAEQLAEDGPDGAHAVRTALKELEATSYLRRERERDDAGHWLSRSVVYERPWTDSPNAENRGRGNRGLKPEELEPLEGLPTEELNPLADGGKAPSAPREEVAALCELLRGRIIANGVKPPAVTAAWLDAARLLLDRDERPLNESAALVRWATDDPFWRANIHSMPTFRKQYDKIRLARLRPTAGGDQLDGLRQYREATNGQ